MSRKVVALDANILIRAVLGQRVRRTLEAHVDKVSFFIPETAYAEAEEHLATLAIKRGGDPAKALAMLRAVAALGTIAGLDLYGAFEAAAPQKARCARSGRLAYPGHGAGFGLPDLDRGHRLLRLRRGHLDLRQHRHLSGPVVF